MVTAIALLAAAAPYYGASGIPSSDSPGAKQIAMQSHNASLKVDDKGVNVSSLSVFRNGSDKAQTINIWFPRYMEGSNLDDLTPFPIQATWDKKPLAIKLAGRGLGTPPPSGDGRISDVPFMAQVTFAPKSTHSLAVTYRTGLGQTGYARKQHIVVYNMAGAGAWAGPVSQVNVALSYTQGEVFNLPDVKPDWHWQVGRNGAFVRLADYSPAQNDEAVFVFYPSGFGGK